MSDLTLDEVLLKLCSEFNKRAIDYVVIGGFALIMHGSNRATEDIDFFIRNSAENVEKIKEVLFDFFKDKSLKELSQEDMEICSVVRFSTPEAFHIDLIARIGEKFTFDDVFGRKQIFEFEGVEIAIPDIDTLIAMKRTVRPKDLMDLRFLLRKKEEQDNLSSSGPAL